MRDDIMRALEEFEIKTIGNKKNIEKAEALLSASEKVLFISPTNLIVTTANTRKKENLPGVVILTDQRVVFNFQIMFSSSTEIVALDEIRSINSNTNGMTGGHIELHTMTKTSLDKGIQGKEAKKVLPTLHKTPPNGTIGGVFVCGGKSLNPGPSGYTAPIVTRRYLQAWQTKPRPTPRRKRRAALPLPRRSRRNKR